MILHKEINGSVFYDYLKKTGEANGWSVTRLLDDLEDTYTITIDDSHEIHQVVLKYISGKRMYLFDYIISNHQVMDCLYEYIGIETHEKRKIVLSEIDMKLSLYDIAKEMNDLAWISKIDSELKLLKNYLNNINKNGTYYEVS
ncbi:hypothetical protein [Bacillus sp. Marseille-P3800]|uniref:hypothetical protein n=1 Tax=Bacillus sp. Marseille-P3800 TaxID=2014782 RepID=UPI000C06BA33|nr:hypothetical protein [Bacillus sp. Marseille-P3800]